MKAKLFSKSTIFSAAFVTTTALIITACGNDSNPQTSTENNSPISSSSSVQPLSSGIVIEACDSLSLECGYTEAELCAVGITQYCNDTQDPNAQQPSVDYTMDTPCATGVTPTPVEFPQDTWTDIGEVYKNIQCNEKVVFIVRHAQRSDQTGIESPLTHDGLEAAVEAGKQLIGPEKFRFVNSGFLRTFQTVYYMAIGRGQYQPSPAFYDSLATWKVISDLEEGFVPAADFPTDTITQITDGWFLKDKDLRDQYAKRDSISNVNEMYSKWIYEGLYEDVYYNLDERCNEILKSHLVKEYSKMPKFTLMGSHDQFLMPLISWATDKKINLIFRDRVNNKWKWVGFLSGLAIIINDKNEIRYAPIKGMDEGYGR